MTWIFNYVINPLSICTWFFKTSIPRNWFLNLFFCRFQTWFLQATQAVKIKFELDKKSSLFRNQFFSSLKLRKKSSDTRYFKNQVEIDRGFARNPFHWTHSIYTLLWLDTSFNCILILFYRFLLKALDMYWHEDCLKCGCCDCRLGEVGSTLYTKGNLLLCRRDYLRYVSCTV